MDTTSGSIAKQPEQPDSKPVGIVEKVQHGVAGVVEHGKQMLGNLGDKVGAMRQSATTTTTGTTAAAGHAHHEGGNYPAHETFEEKTYKDARGAETPDGLVEKLHLHDPKGQEYEGAPISGRSEPFNSPQHGASAPTSAEDRPVKLQSHDYHHETSAQRDTTGGGGEDASYLSMEGGGQMSKTSGEGGVSGGKPGPAEEAAGGTEHYGGTTTANPPAGAYATTSEQDPPNKMMPHHREEEGVEGRRRQGATSS